MKKLKELVEKIIDYTKTWSVNETEWYWNIDCVRKSNYINEEHITDKEFEAAIREEILYDLIYKNGAGTLNQMENDLENYGVDEVRLFKDSEELEKEIQKILKDFKVYRYYKVGEDK